MQSTKGKHLPRASPVLSAGRFQEVVDETIKLSSTCSNCYETHYGGWGCAFCLYKSHCNLQNQALLKCLGSTALQMSNSMELQKTVSTHTSSLPSSSTTLISKTSTPSLQNPIPPFREKSANRLKKPKMPLQILTLDCRHQKYLPLPSRNGSRCRSQP